MLLEKCLVELLSVDIDAPAFPVNDHMNMVGLRCRQILVCNLRIQHRTHHRSIAVAIQQVQSFVTVKPLLVVSEIQ